MGTMLGNFLALITVVASAFVGFVSFEASAITFVAIAYVLWLMVLLSNLFTKPSKDAPLCRLMHPKEIETYRRYHLHFWFSGAAHAYSALLNGLRLAGFVWGGLCLWKGLYWLGGASIAYFFITGGLILKLNPWLYMGTEAQKGNQVASEQLHLMERVQAKRDAYNAEPEV